MVHQEGSLGHQPEEATQRVLHHVEQSAAVPAGVRPADALAAVLCALARRLAADPARGLAYRVPPSLERFVVPCAVHQGGGDEPFDRGEFLRRVGEHLGIAPGQAEDVARVVFAAVQTWMPEPQVREIAGQLPRDFQDLWRPRAA
jgi:uncharacterized protein (DUF2267 family)